MTNKPLILLGVVTALALAGGQAYAASCPGSAPVTVVESPGFSCTLPGIDFTNFVITNTPGDAGCREHKV
jgi:hypothetical protein